MVTSAAPKCMRPPIGAACPALAVANSTGALAVPCTPGGGSSGDDIATPPRKCDTGRGGYVVPYILRSLCSPDALTGTTRRSAAGTGSPQTSAEAECPGPLARAARFARETVHPATPNRRKSGVDRGPRGEDSVGLPKCHTSVVDGGRV